MKISSTKEIAIASDSQTVGIDLGDKFSHYCMLAENGELMEEGRITTTAEGFTSHFQGVPKLRIALETGTHSAWVSQLLTSFGHEVIVANACQIPAITGSDKKTDPNDAENLARFARSDPKLLHPIAHRDRSKQLDLTVIRLRARIVDARTAISIRPWSHAQFSPLSAYGNKPPSLGRVYTSSQLTTKNPSGSRTQASEDGICSAIIHNRSAGSGFAIREFFGVTPTQGDFRVF